MSPEPRLVTLPPDVVLRNGDSIEVTTTYALDGSAEPVELVAVKRADGRFRTETSPHTSRLYVAREEPTT